MSLNPADLQAFWQALTKIAPNLVTPNSAQVQQSGQQGAFNTIGTTDTTGTQQQNGVQQGKTDTTQQTNGTSTGTTVGNTTQQQTGTGTTQQTGTTGVTDTLGFGKLLQGASTGASANDDAANNFLRGLVTNGPTQQQGLTSQAVSQALSGPGMIGVGDGARARAATNAATQVGLNSLNQELQGSAQLRGPSAVTTLAAAGNPFLGQISSTTGQNTTNQSLAGTNTATNTGTTTGSTTGTQNSLNLSDMVTKSGTSTNENQSGTSSATGQQMGIGTNPPSTTQSGGCYVCTAYVDLGWMNATNVALAAAYKLRRSQYWRSLRGYSIYGPFLAKLVLRHNFFARLFFPVARAVLNAELNLAGLRECNKFDRTCHWLFHYGSSLVAIICNQKQVKQCDHQMQLLLMKHNLLFTCLLG